MGRLTRAHGLWDDPETTDALARPVEVALACLIGPGAGIAAVRALPSGLSAGVVLQLLVAVGIVCLVALRRHIPTRLRAGLGVALLVIYGAAGLITWGLLGQGLLVLATTQAYAVLLGGRRMGASALLLSVAVTAGVGAGFVSGHLEMRYNASTYATAWPAWTVAMLSVAIVGVLLLLAHGALIERWRVASERLSEREAELVASEREKLAILDSLTDHVVYHGVGHKVLWANKAYHEYAGTRPGEGVGDECAYDGPDRCDGCPVPHAVLSGKLECAEIELDSGQVWSVHAHPVYGDGSELIGIVEVSRDITEQRRAESEHRELQEGIARTQRLETIGVLAGGIAHDFNNLLSPILGYSDLLALDFPEKSRHRDMAERIHSAGSRAKDLVAQILSFSRKTEAGSEACSLQPVLKETVKFIRSSLPASVQMEANLDPSCGPVSIDPTQFHQIAMNLCTNAAHAMRKTDGVLRIDLQQVDVDESLAAEIGCREPGLHARLTVSDTGEGMNSATTEHIFEPFFTTKPEGEGTGLGLSTVRGIVANCAGGSHIHSELGHGTTIKIYLPIAQGEEASAAAEELELPRGNGRIVLVDDEAPVAAVAADMLESLGYSVKTFTDSREALHALQADLQKVDLLITDLTMPHLGGAQILAFVKLARPELPVIIVTGHNVAPDSVADGGLADAVILKKPYGFRGLAATVDQTLAASSRGGETRGR